MASRRHRASSASSAARRFEIPHSRWCSTRHVSSFLTEAIVILLADPHAPSQTRVRDLYAAHLTISVSVLAACCRTCRSGTDAALVMVELEARSRDANASSPWA